MIRNKYYLINRNQLHLKRDNNNNSYITQCKRLQINWMNEI